MSTPARTSRGWLALVVLLAFLPHLPSLSLGFAADDYMHRAVLSGELWLPRTKPWSLYDFGTAAEWRDPGDTVGTLPFWTSPDWKIRFLRPVTSLLLWGEHALFGEHALAHHLVGFALYAGVLLLAHALYRALGLGDRVALLALALFAATNAGALPVGWIANHNTLVEMVLGLAAMVVALRAGGSARGLATALGLALLACLAKESGVVVLAWIAAVLVLRHKERAPPARRRQLAGALAALLLAAGYLAFLALAGYGVRNAFYASPWNDPVRYAGRAGILATAGLLRLVLPLPLDLLTMFPRTRGPAILAGIALAWPLALAVARGVRGRRGVPELALWLALSLAAQGAAPASDRLLFGAAIGSAGLLALWIGGLLERARTPRRRLAVRGLAGALLLAGAAGTHAASSAMLEMTRITRAAALATDVGPPLDRPRQLVVVQPPDGMLAFALPSAWAVEHEDRDLRFWLLQIARRAVEWTRTGERSFELRALEGAFFTHPFEYVYRSSFDVPPPGTTFETALFRASVVEVSAEGPTRLRFEFDEPLEAPHLAFLVARDGRLVRVPPPPLGSRVVLDRPAEMYPLAP